MTYIRNYVSYKRYIKINEELIGKSIQGILSKLFGSESLKDMMSDIKKSFNETDPNSIKGIIITNFNRSIDKVKKILRNKNISKPEDVINIIDEFTTNLTNIANNIDKDIDVESEKSKNKGAKMIAKSILLGNKEAEWNGFIGLMNDEKYKYSKSKYIDELNRIIKNGGQNVLKSCQDFASKFFDNLQKDISSQLNANLSENEITKIFNDANKGVNTTITFDYNKLKSFYDKKIPVRYKKNGYDDNKKPEEQKNGVIGIKLIDTIDDQGNVGFKGENGTFRKKYSDILGPEEQKNDVNKNLAIELGKIKNNKEKMGSIDRYVKFLQTAPRNKIAEVDNLIKPKENNEQ